MEYVTLNNGVQMPILGYGVYQKSVEESMKKLKTDYLDLVLPHQPFSDAYGAIPGIGGII